MKMDGILMLVLGMSVLGGMSKASTPSTATTIVEPGETVNVPILVYEPLKADQVGNISGAIEYGTKVRQKVRNNPYDNQVGYVVGILGVTGNQTYDVKFPNGTVREGADDIEVA